MTLPILKMAVIGALGLWSALLMNKGIANFHDGLRPVMPEFLGGRMSRAELTAIAFGISLGFVVGISPLTLATGIILTHIVLLPTDVIGAASPKTWIAALGGLVWGLLVVLGLQGIYTAVDKLPVNFLAPLASLALPLIFAFPVFPTIAVGYQFGVVPGLVTLGLAGLARQLVVKFGTITVAGIKVSLSGDAAAMLVGMLALVFYAVQKDRRNNVGEGASSHEAFFSSQAARIRKNLPYIAVQGALLAAATRLGMFGWNIMDAQAAASGKFVEAGVASIALALGFLPLIATTALATGVYQAVGLCFVFPAAYFSPNPVVAAIAGAAVISVEVLLLEQIGNLLDRYPTLRESADSLRASMEKVVTLALLAGSMMAADKMMPGGMGYFLVAGLVVLNEIAGKKITQMAAAPMAAILVGILANILVVIGIMPPVK